MAAEAVDAVPKSTEKTTTDFRPVPKARRPVVPVPPDDPGYKGTTNTTATPFFASVKAKAGEEAVSKVVNLITDKSDKNPTENRDYVFVVNNLSDFDLRRTETAGNDGNWPLGDIKKGRCVASVLDRNSMSVAVQYTASDDKGTDGKKTIALAGSRPKIFSKRIGIYTGKSAKHAWNRMPVGSDFTDKYGNRAMVKEKRKGYVYEYHIVALGYEQITVDCGQDAVDKAVEQLVSQSEVTKMPRFIIIVNNCSGFDLRRTAVVEKAGIWPLDDIPKGKCAVTGFDKKTIHFSAQYTAAESTAADTADGDSGGEAVAVATTEVSATKKGEKTIALAGSWVTSTVGTSKRTLNISIGTSAQIAIENMSEGADISDDKENRAMIQEREGSRVFMYEIKELAPGDDRMDIAVDRIVAKKKKMPTFVFVVLNNTKHTLRRTTAAGDFAWPLGDIRGNECVAESFDYANVKAFSVEYTVKEDDNKIKVTLAGKWPLIGKSGIGIFIGDDAKTALDKFSKEHTHLDGKNQVEIAKYSTGHVFRYTINEVHK